jgi:ADP-ribose pyrophosphatase
MSPQDETLLSTPRFDVVRRQSTDFDGTVEEREVVLHRGAVVILPLLADGRVVLIRNRRAAAGETLWEVPAGTREPGEPPEMTALRELQEETGYSAGQIEWVREFFVSPGILSELMQLYRATDLIPGPTALEPGEHIQVQAVRWDDALAMAMSGEIRDAKTLVALWDHQLRVAATG